MHKKIKRRIIVSNIKTYNNMKTRKLSLNVGLLNNPMHADKIVGLLSSYLFDRYSYAVLQGKYNDIDEPTLVIQGETNKTIAEVRKEVSRLCSELTQECIPYELATFGELVYNANYTGEKYYFDRNYFLKILA